MTSSRLRVVDVSAREPKVTPMNALGELLRNRREVLRQRGEKVTQIAERAGLPESTVYEYLKKTQPMRSTPQRKTLERLARGFKLNVEDVISAAKDSTAPLVGADPLPALLRSAQVESGRSARQAVRKAKAEGHRISEARLSSILNGEAGNLSDHMIAAVAAGYDLDADVVRAAYRQSADRKRYRLPPHLEQQMTPDRWAKILKIVEQILTVE